MQIWTLKNEGTFQKLLAYCQEANRNQFGCFCWNKVFFVSKTCTKAFFICFFSLLISELLSFMKASPIFLLKNFCGNFGVKFESYCYPAPLLNINISETTSQKYMVHGHKSQFDNLCGNREAEQLKLSKIVSLKKVKLICSVLFEKLNWRENTYFQYSKPIP
jgi:hypothetical protein